MLTAASPQLYQEMGVVQRLPRAAVIGFGRGDTLGKSGQAVADASKARQDLQPGTARDRLYALQEQVGRLPEVECPLQHTFAKGSYARTMFMAAGTVLVGKIHKVQHITCLAEGDVSIFSEAQGAERFSGPKVWVTEPGTKRAIYAHTDVFLTTFHVTDKTDLDEIEDELIAASFDELQTMICAGQPGKGAP